MARIFGVRRIGLAAALLAALLGFAMLGARSQSHPASTPGPLPQASRRFTVVAAPMIAKVSAVGKIQPNSKTVVLAPFDGYVASKSINFGDKVAKDQPMLTIDQAELNKRIRDAEMALLKAKMNLDNMSNWDSGVEVLRARRALSSSTTALSNLEQQHKDSKALFDRGIVSRNEYDNLVQQVESQRALVASARQDLDATLSKGSSENKRVIELEFANARSLMDELNDQAKQAIVRAPTAGLVMHAPASNTEGKADAGVVDVGVHLSKGQGLFTIASLEKYAVEALVDEVDINGVRLGQPVEIESDSFPGKPIIGEISAIGIEADGPTEMNGMTKFKVRASFAAEADQRNLIRFGMSASVKIVTANRPDAFVVPSDAITTRDNQLFARVVDASSNESKLAAVVIGMTLPTGIEIKNGLSAGDIVVLP